MDTALQDLIGLSRELGREDRQLAILGEGNTSVDNGDETFWINGIRQPARHDRRLRLQPRADGHGAGPAPGQAPLRRGIAEGLRASLVDPSHGHRRSECPCTICLAEGGARWVGHTHTVSINQILCSHLGAEPFLHHLFPDRDPAASPRR